MDDRADFAEGTEKVAAGKLIEEAVGILSGAGQEGTKMAFNLSVHKRMNNEVTEGRLSQQALFALNYGNISQDASSATTGKMENHFCNNRLIDGLRYTDKTAQEIRASLSKVNLSDSELLDIVRQVGARMHTLQDFYAHSNYVELALAKDPSLRPEDLKLMDWNDLRNGQISDLRSGFYFYKNSAVNELVNKMTRQEIVEGLTLQKEKIPGTKYVSDFWYEREREKGFSGALHLANEKRYTVLHVDTAKDNAESEQGKVVNPRTGSSLFNYARHLALRETMSQWKAFESMVKEVKGEAAGARLLDRIGMLSTQVEKQPWYNEFPEGKATKNAELVS